MIIIKEPIKLNCRDQMKTVSNNLHHRIMANYQLMPVDLGKEELLHMMTSPPEIYLATDENTTILNSNTVFDNKEIKIDVMNNLLNRLSIHNQFQWTYQDKIYIETVLRKLGIKNTINFMEVIQKKMVTNQSLEEKIEKYWNYIISYREEEENHREEILINKEDIFYDDHEDRIYLHEAIMNRLQTGLIYRIIDNFNTNNQYNSSIISNHQLMLTEQKKTARQILLNQMETYLTGEEIPFIYLEKNTYESIDQEEEYYEEKVINQRITEAVLHQLIDSVYMERLTSYKEEKNLWMNLRNALYQTAENTLFRMQNTSSFYKEIQKNTEYILNKKDMAIQNFYENRNEIVKKDHLLFPKETFIEEEKIYDEYRTHDNTEIIKQQLEKINQKNIENLEKLQTVLQDTKELPKRRILSKEEQRRESLRALQAPEELLLQYREEAVFEEVSKEVIRKEVMENLPQDTRYIMETIERFRTLPQETKEQTVSKNNLAMLLEDTKMIHAKTVSETNEIKTEEKEINLETERIIEKWKRESGQAVTSPPLEDRHPYAAMIHKKEKQFVEEEVLQELLEKNRRNLQEKKEEEVILNQKHTVTKVHHQEQTEITEKHLQDITRMIDQGVKRQIGTISDQVYHRLERKLSNEKKRRGF